MLPSLLFVVRVVGKGLFVVCHKKQTAKDLFADPVFAVTVCRPPLTAKLFAVRRPCLCRPPWQATKYWIPVVNDEHVMINGMVEICMAIYLGMAMEMP